MKAIIQFRFFQLFIFVCMASIGYTALGHHATDQLELYPGDEADTCLENAQQVRVTVHGVSHQGIMKLELYADRKGFLYKKGRERWVRVEAQDGPMRICMDVPWVGRWAVVGYHDRDGDRKLDKKLFKPKEPYAISNNLQLRGLRIPKFKEAAFDVTNTGVDITLKLKVPKKKK